MPAFFLLGLLSLPARQDLHVLLFVPASICDPFICLFVWQLLDSINKVNQRLLRLLRGIPCYPEFPCYLCLQLHQEHQRFLPYLARPVEMTD